MFMIGDHTVAKRWHVVEFGQFTFAYFLYQNVYQAKHQYRFPKIPSIVVLYKFTPEFCDCYTFLVNGLRLCERD